MSYQIEKLEHNEVMLSFEVDAETLEKATQKAYEQTKHKYAVPGFRKGHATRKVIESTYGKGVFFDDACDIVINDEYTACLEKETSLEVVASPEKLESFDLTENGGIKFSVKVVCQPDVKLGKYKGLSIEKKVEKITADQIDAEIKVQQEKQARISTTDKAAKKGNIAKIDYVGSVDGVEFEGGKGEDFDLELGSGTFIPGFEDQLIGTKAGDKKDVKVTFPADYQAENLAGKEAIFACTVKEVKVKEIPALDDDFAKEASETANTVAEYKAEVKAKLEKDAEQDAENKWMDDVVKAIVADSECEVPDIMAKQEAEEMVKEFEYRLMYQGMKLDDYLGYVNMTKEQLTENYLETAKETVKTRLIVSEIIKKEDIQLEQSEIEEEIKAMAEMYGQDTEAFKKNMNKEMIDYIYNKILSKKFSDFIKASNSAAKKAPAKKAVKAEEKVEEAPAAEEKKAPAKKAPAKKAAPKKAE